MFNKSFACSINLDWFSLSDVDDNDGGGNGNGGGGVEDDCVVNSFEESLTNDKKRKRNEKMQ